MGLFTICCWTQVVSFGNFDLFMDFWIHRSIHYNVDNLFQGHIVACTLWQLDAASSPLAEKLEHEQATDDTLTPRGNCNERDTIHTLRWVIVAYCWSLNNTSTEGLIKGNKETAVRWIERTEIENKLEPWGLTGEKISFQVCERENLLGWFTCKSDV